jgi:hypothetical protein
VIDAMRTNHGYSSEGSHGDEEPNVEVTRFFELLKYFDKLLWDGCTNHNKYLLQV